MAEEIFEQAGIEPKTYQKASLILFIRDEVEKIKSKANDILKIMIE